MLVLYIEKARLKTQNTIIFEARDGHSFRERKLKIEYTGTELNPKSSFGITEDQKEQLRIKLKDDYGLPPFKNKEEIEKKSEEGKRYELK